MVIEYNAQSECNIFLIFRIPYIQNFLGRQLNFNKQLRGLTAKKSKSPNKINEASFNTYKKYECKKNQATNVGRLNYKDLSRK